MSRVECHPRWRQRQCGVTLVELMIALVIGLLLMGLILQVYLGASESYRLQENMARVQESGRFVVDALGRDLRVAGYSLCGSLDTMDINDIVDPNPPGNQPPPLFAGWNWGSGDALQPADPDGRLQGTDAFTIIRASGGYLNVVEHSSQPNVLRVAGNEIGLKQGDVVFVTDCRQADIFRITNSPQQTDDPDDLVNLNFDSNLNTANKLQGNYPSGSMVMTLSTVTYFIADTGRKYPDGAPVPALFRDSGSGPRELAEGVENMRIHYGTDTNENKSVDAYRLAGDVDDWSRVISARVSVLIQTQDRFPTDAAQELVFDNQLLQSGDHRLRRVFTTTAAMRNRTG